MNRITDTIMPYKTIIRLSGVAQNPANGFPARPLVEHYEDKHYPIGPPDPVVAIEFEMDQRGLTRQDLVPYIGSPAKVAAVLSRQEDITMPMARALHKHLGIAAETLL